MSDHGIEHRSDAIARALALRLHDAERARLEDLARARELHPATRSRIACLRRYRDRLRAGGLRTAMERRFVEDLAESLERALGIRRDAPSTPRARAPAALRG